MSDNARRKVIFIRVNDAEHKVIVDAASRSGKPTAEYGRSILMETSKKGASHK